MTTLTGRPFSRYHDAARRCSDSASDAELQPVAQRREADRERDDPPQRPRAGRGTARSGDPAAQVRQRPARHRGDRRRRASRTRRRGRSGADQSSRRHSRDRSARRSRAPRATGAGARPPAAGRGASRAPRRPCARRGAASRAPRAPRRFGASRPRPRPAHVGLRRREHAVAQRRDRSGSTKP